MAINPLPADHDFCRYPFVLFVDQITEIGKQNVCFAKDRSQINHI